ncbi:hypothetical protein BBO99_00008754 [Phytophthora kernoviae]|uniref:Uncharacterized protein n=2 Tax=Phytophthora kernoviae TaxID=325452 RepID=A0A3R7MW80_9STRA|nr:hypothetical protein G195_001520 [Phytophthora kernoviae 00238/432]KAG2531839.1 hypothetical protein JM16_000712 [Phytophthora kernoviae]KAG2532728.1 hypothetical protein JM18_000794 [Phytophthora kernoviae]RLN44928.1 hypothetical protein BBI17_008777 [Phytophthora kernoviae]RLN74763.1 hypothetical protein BBO99_00008754 [Phytophthora kernoviae]
MTNSKHHSSPVLPPRYSSRLFRSSFATCFSVAGALRSGLWGCAFVALIVLLTSLNYWRNPVQGWRHPLVQVLYALFVANSGFCYLQARKAPNHDASTAWHCGLHLLGNAANVLLYLGISV